MPVLHKTNLKKNIIGKNPAKSTKNAFIIITLTLSVIFGYTISVLLISAQFPFQITPSTLTAPGPTQLEISSFYIAKQQLQAEIPVLAPGIYSAKINFRSGKLNLNSISLIKNAANFQISLFSDGGNAFSTVQIFTFSVFSGIGIFILTNGIAAHWREQLTITSRTHAE